MTSLAEEALLKEEEQGLGSEGLYPVVQNPDALKVCSVLLTWLFLAAEVFSGNPLGKLRWEGQTTETFER